MQFKSENMKIWEERIADKAKSGLTIDKWCGINGFRKSQYYYWKKQIQRKQSVKSRETFAEVTSILSGAHNAKPDKSKESGFQIHIKEMIVTVPEHFDAGSLTDLMRLLNNL